MNKIIIIIFAGLLVAGGANACEICGCGIGSNYIGILPEFNKNIFGFRYRYNAMQTHLGIGGSTTYLTTSEQYHTAEAWGAVNLTPNFRLMGSVPYSFDSRNNQGKTSQKNGLGDISLSAYYQLVHSRKPVLAHSLLVQSLWVGAGVKLATGKYNPLDNSENNESANLFQLGTGSTDFSVTAMYDIRLQDLGLNLTSSYKFNTANRYDYRYGNKFNGSAQCYYKVRATSRLTLSPNAGVLVESGRKDLDRGLQADISGGNLLLGTVGVEAIFKNVAIGGNWQTPLSQQLANGIVRANDRVMIHAAIMF